MITMSRPYYNLKKFNLTKRISITCKTQNTNYGFRHVATLDDNYREISTAKACYYNRTWESYTYQSVIYDIIVKSGLGKSLQSRLKNKADKIGSGAVKQELQTIGTIASLGNVLASNKKDKNDWKLRIIKAGLGNKGIDIPKDWETLNENEKQLRLDRIIKALNK